MIRLTWLQFRLQSVVAFTALALIALALALTGPHLAHLYDTTVANCQAQGDCQTATSAFLQNDQALQSWLGPLLLIVPALIGIFWGAPLVARELEAGTYRLVWTQNVTRTRWLVVKLGLLGLASVAVAGLLSLMVTWWSSPFDKVAMNQFGSFDQRDIVPIGYAAFAFVLGVTAGVLIRHTVPAMAATVVTFAGGRLATAIWVRPLLMSPAHTSMPITSVTNLVVTPTIPNAWVYSSQVVDKAGHAPTSQFFQQFLQTACPGLAIPNGGPRAIPGLLPGTALHLSGGPANQAVFQPCIAKLSANFHLAVTYQPASRYWTFQWYEMGIFLAFALILAAGCFWWVRYRLA